jgi:hypothetical protein
MSGSTRGESFAESLIGLDVSEFDAARATTCATTCAAISFVGGVEWTHG